MSDIVIRKSTVYRIIEWVQEWFEENGKGCTAVIGISGGKDSTITAKLLVEALGKDRVFGVLMPNKYQSDIDVARSVCEYLGIDNIEIDINDAYLGIADKVSSIMGNCERAMITNLPARLRMATLYAVAQNLPNGGRVANTCNYSEDYIGYSTRYGDSAGDFSLLAKFTVEEVKQIGNILGIPSEFVNKVPTDGLCGATDEDNLGFTYEQLDKYIHTTECDDEEVKNKIDYLHKLNLFKMEPMPCCPNHENLRTIKVMK